MVHIRRGALRHFRDCCHRPSDRDGSGGAAPGGKGKSTLELLMEREQADKAARQARLAQSAATKGKPSNTNDGIERCAWPVTTS